MMNEKMKIRIKHSMEHHTLSYDAMSYLIYKMGYGTPDISCMLPHRKAFLWLKKRYSKYLGHVNESYFKSGEDMSADTVWTCWLQGEEKAPYLVKCCFDSMREHLKGKRIIILTEDNFKNYCTIPDYIIKKWKDGIISHPHFSDILRSQVLIEHGGLWIDSTTYLTGKFPEYITEGDFFVYHDGRFDMETINMCNWLIHSKPQSHILKETMNLIYRYWADNNYVKSYYIYQLFFRMVTDEYPEEWSSVQYYNAVDQHIFANEFLKTYDEKRFNNIRQLTSVHKLTNKFDKNLIEDDSYYSRLNTLYRE